MSTRPLTEDEIKLVKNSFRKLRDRCLVELGIATGFRISELLSIKIQDIIEYGQIKDFVVVGRSKMKGKAASRSIPIGADIKTLLQNYISNLSPRQEYLFASRESEQLSRVQAWRVLKQAFTKHQMKGKLATHSMRKTFCTNIYNLSGKDLLITQKAMGHKSVASTQHYIQVDAETVNNLILLHQQVNKK